MKCSGKHQSYPSEMKRLKKAIQEQELNDALKKAQKNEKNINSMTHVLRKDSEELKQEIKSLDSQNKKASESISFLTSQLGIISNRIDVLDKKMTNCQQQQVSIIASILEYQEKINSTTKTITDELNRLEQQTEEKMDNLVSMVSAVLTEVKPVRILRWDSGNFSTFITELSEVDL